MDNHAGQKKHNKSCFCSIVYLDDYAEVFGNKKMSFTDQYLNYKETDG